MQLQIWPPVRISLVLSDINTAVHHDVYPYTLKISSDAPGVHMCDHTLTSHEVCHM